MKALVLIGLVCLIGAVLIGVATSVVARFQVNRARNTLVNRLGARTVVTVDTTATFYGLASGGRRQEPHPGILVLTHDEVVFEQRTPKREVRLNRMDLVEVSARRTFEGRASRTRLLTLTWTTPDGSRQRGAWRLQDLNAWLKHLSH